MQTPSERRHAAIRTAGFVIVALCALPSTPAAGQQVTDVIGPRVRLIAASGGRAGPLAPIMDGSVGDVGLAVSVRFATDDIDRWAPGVENTGVELHYREGERVCVGRVCGAYVPFGAIESLADAPGVERVEAGWIPLLRRPLYETVGEIGGRQAHEQSAVGRLTGDGVVIGNIDQPIDIFHPAFLRADGGFVPWIDIDGDGIFGTGDAIDADDDGTVDVGERITVLDGTRFWWDATEIYEENSDGVFQPDQDWAFADRNGNGRRDNGAGAGFTEGDPGYGEPIFIADDVDGDGWVDRDEKFIALATSRVSTVVVDDETYVRGIDLIHADTRGELRDGDGPMATSHATGVAGILGAGSVTRSRLAGVAPGAELVALVHTTDADGDPILALVDAAERLDIDILLHEYSGWDWVPLDGSSNVELAMQTARDGGMHQVTPAGNLARSEKHARHTILATGTAMTITVPEEVRDGTPVGAMLISLHWDAAEAGPAPHIVITAPGGDRFTLDGSAADGAWWFDRHAVFDMPDVTPAGTATRFIYVGTEDGYGSMRAGTYRLDITATAGAFEMHVYADDYWSGWDHGVSVGRPEPATTLC